MLSAYMHETVITVSVNELDAIAIATVLLLVVLYFPAVLGRAKF